VTTEQSAREHYEVVVVGAGQAGLAIGYFLARQGRRFVILDRAGSVGAAWRERWESLTLFTPRRYNSLSGLPFPGDPDGYPNRDEVISYLERYAQTFELPVELNSNVQWLTREDGRFLLELKGRRITADQVVVATGPFQAPRVPELTGGSRRRSTRRTAPATGDRATCRKARCSSWAEATPVFRSRRSCRRRTRSSSPSARARRRFRRGSAAAISSGG
jgi:cation diffusion facilitator CzcD-associated flavoprotein CzcO